jgi:hypothetical protein
MRRFLVFGLALSLSMGLARVAEAKSHPLRIVPKVHDPKDVDRLFSGFWPVFLRDGFEFGLLLVKDMSTYNDAAAGAEIEGVNGIVLQELGFDTFNAGRCAGGAARFNVITADALYFFTCATGDHTPSPDSAQFTRVRFTDADAAPQYPSDPPWPGFGKAVIKQIQIIFDEGIDVGPGFSLLTDIDVNGIIDGT